MSRGLGHPKPQCTVRLAAFSSRRRLTTFYLGQAPAAKIQPRAALFAAHRAHPPHSGYAYLPDPKVPAKLKVHFDVAPVDGPCASLAPLPRVSPALEDCSFLTFPCPPPQPSDWVVAVGPRTFADPECAPCYDWAVVSDGFQVSLYVLARDPAQYYKEYNATVFEYLEKEGFNTIINRPIVSAAQHERGAGFRLCGALPFLSRCRFVLRRQHCSSYCPRHSKRRRAADASTRRRSKVHGAPSVMARLSNATLWRSGQILAPVVFCGRGHEDVAIDWLHTEAFWGNQREGICGAGAQRPALREKRDSVHSRREAPDRLSQLRLVHVAIPF